MAARKVGYTCECLDFAYVDIEGNVHFFEWLFDMKQAFMIDVYYNDQKCEKFIEIHLN